MNFLDEFEHVVGGGLDLFVGQAVVSGAVDADDGGAMPRRVALLVSSAKIK